ncbi:MAG: OmpH family outer membrane protein [Acidobacteriota bacterium]
MKLRNVFLATLALGLLATGAFGQALKVGFVEPNKILSSVDEGKFEIEKVQKFMEEKQNDFNRKQDTLNKLNETYTAQQAKLNPETRAEMEKQIDEQGRELKRYGEDTQVEINRKRDLLLNTLGQRIQVVIEEYAKENNFSVIFSRDDGQVFVSPALDVSDEIIKRFNAKHPLTGAKPAGDAAKPAAEKKPPQQ